MSHNIYKKQKGNLLVLSIFIIVAVGFLGMNLISVEINNKGAITKEVLGTQAWFLAYSGVEVTLVELFPLNNDGANVSICNDEVDISSTLQLENHGCNSVPIVTCQYQSVDNRQYFKITSKATCGTGVNRVTRAQEVWVQEVER